MNSSNVLYRESWDSTKHFTDKEVVPTEHTLTISETQEEYKVEIVGSYVNLAEGVGDSCLGPMSCRDLDKCVEYALDKMNSLKTSVGLWNIDYSELEIESIISNLTGITKDEASRISWNEVFPSRDDKMTELCKRGFSNEEAWDYLVERENKRVAHSLNNAHEYRVARRK